MRYIKLFEQNTPKIGIFNAIRYLKISEIKIYLDAGGEVNIQNSAGRTPLMNVVHVAKGSQSKIIKVIRLLVKYGADLDIQDVEGNTALIFSAMKMKYDVMHELIDLGAEWYIKDNIKYDFIDYLEDFDDASIRIFNELIEKYPDKYKDYLLKKQVDQFNL